jgi:hypothetical protein
VVDHPSNPNRHSRARTPWVQVLGWEDAPVVPHLTPTHLSMKTALFALVAVAGIACSRDLTGNGGIHPICNNGDTRLVSVTPASATLNRGDRLTFSAPSLQCYGRVIWTSSHPEVASVDSTGLVSALAIGTTTILATSSLDPTARGAATVTVSSTGPGVVPEITITSLSDVATGTPAPSSWDSTLRWNTAQSPNGAYQVKARVRNRTSGTTITTTALQVTVKNP